MIFVTVGTHEQPFNRLVEYMDKWAKKNKEEVVIQTGFSTYEPKNCKWKKIYDHKEMKRWIGEARVIITHGGPSSFIPPLQIGKIPIVVPRLKGFNEHVNDHQMIFCREVAKRQKNIIEVEKIEELGEKIEQYNEIINGMKNRALSNNARFCDELERLIDKMMMKGH